MAAPVAAPPAQHVAPAAAQLSCITDYGESAASCGYCGSRRQQPKRDTSASHGMMAEQLTPETYQELIDRGWRRSGSYIYFPLQDRSCCQLLTIRLDTTRFAPNKEQRRVQRRWQAYLEGAPLRASEQQQAQQDHQQGDSPRALAGGSPKRPHHELEEVQWCTAPAAGQHLGGSCEVEEGRGKRHRHVAEAHGEEKRSPRSASPTAQLSRHLTEALRSHQGTAEGAAEHQLTRQPKQQQAAAAGEAGEARLADLLAAALQQAVAAGALPAAAYPAPKVQQPGAKQRKLLPAAVTFTTAFPLAVAGLAASTQPAAGGNGTGSSAKLSADAVAALLVQHMPDDVAAAAQVAKGHINFAVPVEDGAGAAGAAGPAAAAGQSTAQALHGKRLQRGASNPSSPTAAGIPRGVPRHFELRTLPCIDSSIVEVEYPLFRKYQIVHHGDKPAEVTPRSFSRFLVDSPLVYVTPEQLPQGNRPSTGFGSFHQQYWLDGRLVAVGVVDVLPRCLSSVYLFWDTDLAPLSLGKLTSLAEIEWVRAEQQRCPALRYYYLGFYIHDCHRMRYKGDFAPSDLLCPKNKCWVPLARVAGALEQPGMVAISELPRALAGLGTDYLVDPASGAPASPPRLPSEAELAASKLRLHLPGAGGQRQTVVVSLGQLQAAGMLRAGGGQLLSAVGTWWSRVGPAAAAGTAYALD